MINLAFFASGGGSNVQAILNNIKFGSIAAVPRVIITNNSQAGIVNIAVSEGIPYYHISSVTHTDERERTAFTLKVLAKHNAELIILAGYMKKIPDEIIDVYKNHILNIHPALLPKYGGKGMYGMNVHRAVYEAGESVSGATIFVVNKEYDRGEILAQKKVDISNADKPEDIQKKVLRIEHMLYSEVIQNIALQKIQLNNY